MRGQVPRVVLIMAGDSLGDDMDNQCYSNMYKMLLIIHTKAGIAGVRHPMRPTTNRAGAATRSHVRISRSNGISIPYRELHRTTKGKGKFQSLGLDLIDCKCIWHSRCEQYNASRDWRRSPAISLFAEPSQDRLNSRSPSSNAIGS